MTVSLKQYTSTHSIHSFFFVGIQKDIRKRALRKREREQAAALKTQ